MFITRGTVLLITSLTAGLFTSLTWAEDYIIDLSHSFIQFKISHLSYSVLVGRFNDFSGTFSYYPDEPGKSRISLEIKTASIDSNWAKRDKHLRGPDFLDVDMFSEATFVSTAYREKDGAGTLKGDLTLNGTSQPITIAVQPVGHGKDPWGGYRRGFQGQTEIKRSDFGISYNLGPSADVMRFELFLEGIRQPVTGG